MAVSAWICDLDHRHGVSEALAAGKGPRWRPPRPISTPSAHPTTVSAAYITVMGTPGPKCGADAGGQSAALRICTACPSRSGSHRGGGVRATSGSEMLADPCPRHAFRHRAAQTAGAVIPGKLAMHEFCVQSPVLDGAFATGRCPGISAARRQSSSSGSGVAAAARLLRGRAGLGHRRIGSRAGGHAAALAGPQADLWAEVSRSGVPRSWTGRSISVGPMTRFGMGRRRDAPGHRRTRCRRHQLAGRAGAGLPRAPGGRRRAGSRRACLRRFYVDWPGLATPRCAAALAACFERSRVKEITVKEVDAPMARPRARHTERLLAEMYAVPP